jgi:hypothetical protein
MGPDGGVKTVYPPAGSHPMTPPDVMWCYETEELESATTKRPKSAEPSPLFLGPLVARPSQGIRLFRNAVR